MKDMIREIYKHLKKLSKTQGGIERYNKLILGLFKEEKYAC